MVEQQSTAERAVTALGERGLTVATAESMTGGQVSAALSSVSGAGDVLRGGVVAYAAGVKYEVLGVPVGPVVTGDAARAMASGARRLLAADVGVAITGVSGPDPMEGVAVGTVYIGVAHGDDEWSELHLFDGDPDEICGLGTEAALAAVVRCLSDADVTARSPRPRPRDGAQPDERAPADVERLAAGGK